MRFPEGFLWGGATAASQFEGGFAEAGGDGSVLDRVRGGDRKTPRIYDPVPQETYYPSHEACDFYHRFREDANLMAEMGFNTFRMSISWSRIFPVSMEAGPSQEGLTFYHEVFKALNERGIKPLVTLSHYDVPMHLARQGGWSNPAMIDAYLQYAQTVLREYQDEVPYWITFNEINILFNGHGDILSAGMIPDEPTILFDRKDNPASCRKRFQSIRHQLLASARTVKLAHEINPELKIGGMIAADVTYPLTCKPEDVLLAQESMNRNNYFCADVMCRGEYHPKTASWLAEQGVKFAIPEEELTELKAGTVDFLAFSYYMSACTGSGEGQTTSGNMTTAMANPYLEASDWGWQIDAKGLRWFLNELYGRYRMPLMIVENGLGAADVLEDGKVHDPYRIDYMRQHIEQMREAVCTDNVDLLGYTCWGCIDLVSLSTGEMDKRYGMVYVDMDNQGHGSRDRYRKDSFDWYRAVIQSNGECLH